MIQPFTRTYYCDGLALHELVVARASHHRLSGTGVCQLLNGDGESIE